MLIWTILVVATIALLICFHLFFRDIIYEMAKNDRVFTLPTEGEVKIIMSGNRAIEAAYSLGGEDINDKGNIVELKIGEKPRHWRSFEKETLLSPRPLLRKLFEETYHVIWIGFPPYHIFKYRFAWIKYAKEVGEITYKMINREEIVDSIFRDYKTYGLPITDAETGIGKALAEQIAGTQADAQVKADPSQKEPVICDFVFEVELTNALAPLFHENALSTAGDWILSVNTALRDELKPWIGCQTYEELIKIKGTNKFKKLLVRVNKALEAIGVKVTNLLFLNVDLKNKAAREAAQRFFVARQDRLVKGEEAEGRKLLAEAMKAEAQKPLEGLAVGYKQIVDNRAENLYVAQQLGRINVYAPGGGSNLLLDTSKFMENKSLPQAPRPTPAQPATPAPVTPPATPPNSPP